MKKLSILMILVSICLSCGKQSTQKQPQEVIVEEEVIAQLPVYTKVAAAENNADVLKEPDVTAAKLTTLSAPMHGYCPGVLLKDLGEWSKIAVGDVEGYVQTAYLVTQSWYEEGASAFVVIAAQDKTPIYTETYDDNDDDGWVVDHYVGKGTIITNTEGMDEEGYILETAHDYMFVFNKDVDLVPASQLEQYCKDFARKNL
jgi:hypothetical protein